MMSNNPPPLVSSEVDLQDFSYMPLHVARLRDSDFAAEVEPEACWYGVLLWAASWHQIPAGSIPNNDTVLMRMVGLGRDQRTWKKHKEGALHGFVQCSDGRLYHPVVCEQVNAAWNGKLAQAHRTFCAAIRKHNERHKGKELESPTFERWDELGRPDKVSILVTQLSNVTEVNVTDDKFESHVDVGGDIGSKGKGEGEGEGDSKDTVDANASPGADAPNDGVEPPVDPVETLPPAVPKLNAADVQKAVFDTGKQILAAAGSADPGAIIQRWRRTYSNSQILTVLVRCSAEQPEEPISWITAALQAEVRRGNNGSADSKSSGYSQVDKRDGIAKSLQRRLAQLGPECPPGETGRFDLGDGGSASGVTITPADPVR